LAQSQQRIVVLFTDDDLWFFNACSKLGQLLVTCRKMNALFCHWKHCAGPIMFRIFAIVALAIFPPGSAHAESTVTRITVIATMHGLHGKSTTYSYENLYALVTSLKPDFIGVEMRQEDLPRDPQYLASMYPREMIQVAKDYGNKAFGFDWLGDDVAGRQVPADWWANGSPIKALERQLDADSRFSHDAQLDAISAAEKQILTNATAATLNDGRYDRLNDAYYARQAVLYAGTKYDLLPRFYAERDFQLALNVAATIKAHPGSNIVVLTGADHRGELVRHLKLWFGDSVQLLPVK
jgi:hypothetical protein